ncbi:MAG: hypothetical protein MUF25_10785, partial [Pirellulaceae bacterium]|nr:hypothetical protein [Pirellulaceae bacterium]
MKRGLFGWTSIALLVSSSVLATACAASPQTSGIVSPAGAIRIERQGREIATLIPGLFETGWKHASLGEGKAGQVLAGDVHRGKISAPGGTVVDVELRLAPDRGRVGLEYRLTPQADIGLNSLHVSLGLPARHWAGGSFA